MYLNFHCWKSSQKKWQTSQLSRIYQMLTWRLGDMVWNLESPKLSRRVDSTATGHKEATLPKVEDCIATQLLPFLFSPPNFFSFPFPVFSFCWTFTRLHFVGKTFWKHQDHSLLFFLHGIFSILLTWFLNFSFAHFTESHLFGYGLKDFFYLHKLGV